MISYCYYVGMAIRVAGLNLENHLMNAAYIGSKTTKDLKTLLNSSCAAVVVGSISVKPRAQNPGPGYWKHKEGFYALNSYGMPNGGLPYYVNELPKIVQYARARKKLVIANIVGFSTAEFIDLLILAETSGVDIAELNLGCPNAWEAGHQKQIMSYHARLVADLLSVIKVYKPKVKISVKISPLPPDILKEVSQVIIDSKIVHAVVATNSYPNALVNTGTRLNDEEDIAGLTGRALKPISLGVVKQLRDLLPRSIDIIGCGGIYSKNDINDYMAAGSSAVQLATALIDVGPSIFDELLA